jgi:hypothetical protein
LIVVRKYSGFFHSQFPHGRLNVAETATTLASLISIERRVMMERSSLTEVAAAEYH